MHILHVLAAHGQFRFQLRVMGAEPELDAAFRVQRLHPGQQLIGVRLANAIRMKSFQMNRGRRPGPRQNPRNHLFLQHSPHFPGYAGREEKSCFSDIHGETAGGADGIVDHLRRRGQHRLLAVVRRHGPGAAGEETLHLLQPFLMQHQFHPRRPRRDLLRQVVHGRAQSAIDDHGVGALTREREGRQQRFPIVANRGAPVHR